MKNILQQFRKAIFEDAPVMGRLMKIQFYKSTLTESQRVAYETLAKQVDLRVNEKPCDQQHISVPASIDPKDAEKALKLIKLEFDPSWDFHVTWESRTTTLSEKKPPQPGV